MIKAAIENEKSANSVKIANGLAKLKNFQGVTGTITMNQKHNPEKSIVVEKLTQGIVKQTYNVQ